MSRTARFIITALLLLSSGVLLSTPPARSESLRLSAILSTPEGLRYQVLRYGDIDLATQAGSEALYRRINRSATATQPISPGSSQVISADGIAFSIGS